MSIFVYNRLCLHLHVLQYFVWGRDCPVYELWTHLLPVVYCNVSDVSSSWKLRSARTVCSTMYIVWTPVTYRCPVQTSLIFSRNYKTYKNHHEHCVQILTHMWTVTDRFVKSIGGRYRPIVQNCMRLRRSTGACSSPPPRLRQLHCLHHIHSSRWPQSVSSMYAALCYRLGCALQNNPL